MVKKRKNEKLIIVLISTLLSCNSKEVSKQSMLIGKWTCIKQDSQIFKKLEFVDSFFKYSISYSDIVNVEHGKYFILFNNKRQLVTALILIPNDIVTEQKDTLRYPGVVCYIKSIEQDTLRLLVPEHLCEKINSTIVPVMNLEEYIYIKEVN